MLLNSRFSQVVHELMDQTDFMPHKSTDTSSLPNIQRLYTNIPAPHINQGSWAGVALLMGGLEKDWLSPPIYSVDVHYIRSPSLCLYD